MNECILYLFQSIIAYINGMGRTQKVLTSIRVHRLPSLRVKFAPFSVFFTKKQKIFDKDGTVGAQVSCDDAILVRLPNLPGRDIGISCHNSL